MSYLLLCIYFFYDQPGMHVNGAPQMMQPPNMGVVPGSMPVPGPGPGQGPVPVGPPGNHQTVIKPSLHHPQIGVASLLC